MSASRVGGGNLNEGTGDLAVTAGWGHAGQGGVTMPGKEKGVCAMATLTKRATVYFDPDIHRALRLKSAETTRSISALVNDALRSSLAEDAEDLEASEARASDPLISYEQMIERLKADGRLWHLLP